MDPGAEDEVYTVDFRLVNDKVVVLAKINEGSFQDFVVDTGADVCVFPSQLFPWALSGVRSGEILVMVLMGGMGTLFGPLFGAATFLLLEEILSSYTSHWQIIMGPFLVLLVLFAKRGLWSLIPARRSDG